MKNGWDALNKTNETALDLWQQVFSRLADSENAALLQPGYDGAVDEARLREALKEAGWSDEQIALSIEVSNERIANAPTTSPGVNPSVEALHHHLCEDVESAMERLGLSSQRRVARGVEPRLGPSAARINVVMTEESIVTVGAHLFRFCGLIARATTRTLQIDPYFWESNSWNLRDARNRLALAPSIASYWMHIYLSYALTGTHVLAPFKPANKFELILFEQMARAMELFAVAHEYGHHHHAHGQDVHADARKEEFEADQFALKVCYEVEREPLFFDNPYISSGAGGALLLLSLEQLRAIQSLLGLPVAGNDQTHPTASQRVARMDSVAILRPAEFTSLRSFRTAICRIMETVNSLLNEALQKMPTHQLSGLTNFYEIDRRHLF